MIHRNFAAVAAATISFCAAPIFAQHAIERLAPENTVAVIGVKNFQTMMDRVQATSLWALWESEQMKKLREDAMKEMGKGLDKMFEELGVEKDSLVHPSGAVGLAVFTVRDENDLDQPAFLVLADYGDAAKADKTNALIQAALERGEKDRKLEFDHKEIDGRTIYSIDLSLMAPKDEEGQGDDDFDMNGMMPFPKPADMLEGMKKLHYVRDANAFLVCSDYSALTDALENLEAKAAGGRAADRKEYQAALANVGDADVYGALLTRDMLTLIKDEMGMLEMMRTTLRALFGEVHAYGFGVRFDGTTAMVEQTITAYMPNGKAGLSKLIDMPTQQGTVPAFVGPDAVSYTSMSFKFSGLMDVIREAVNANPIMAAQLGPQLDMIAPQVTQITSTLGNQMQWSMSVTKPYTSQSMMQLMAMDCPKPQEFENAFAQLAAQAGIEARDFLGQRIYTFDPAMMMGMMGPADADQPVSLGIGGGFVMVGPTPAVEQGLRATSQPGGASLASSGEFQRAIATLSKEPVIAWGYSDTIDSIEAALAVQREQIEQMIKDMREDAEMWGDDDPDMKGIQDRMEARMRDELKFFDHIDFNLLRQHIGPAAWQVRSTDDGFVLKAYTLSAKAN